MNVNSNEPLFYPYSIFVNKCSGSCNDIDDDDDDDELLLWYG